MDFFNFCTPEDTLIRFWRRMVVWKSTPIIEIEGTPGQFGKLIYNCPSDEIGKRQKIVFNIYIPKKLGAVDVIRNAAKNGLDRASEIVTSYYDEFS